MRDSAIARWEKLKQFSIILTRPISINTLSNRYEKNILSLSKREITFNFKWSVRKWNMFLELLASQNKLKYSIYRFFTACYAQIISHFIALIARLRNLYHKGNKLQSPLSLKMFYSIRFYSMQISLLHKKLAAFL